MTFDKILGYALDGTSFILVLGLAILIHEFGHYIVAIWSGIRVEKFSIGFGKALWSFKRGHTEYIIAPIPMGGYVKFAGDNPAEVEGEDYEFYSVSPWRRIPTILAGPAFNIVGAFLILFGIAFLCGKEYTPNVIGQVITGSLAEEIGLQSNDVIVSAGGGDVETWGDFLDAFEAARSVDSETLDLSILRGGESVEVSIPLKGDPWDHRMAIAQVDEAGPAFKAGVRKNDRIVSMDGIPTTSWTGMIGRTRALLDDTSTDPTARTVSLVWEKPSGEIQSASLTPAIIIGASGENFALFGITPAKIGITVKMPAVLTKASRGMPAREAGLKAGAEILAINDELVDDAIQIPDMVAFSHKPVPKDSNEKVEAVPLKVTWKNPGEEVQTKEILPVVSMTVLPTEIGMQSGESMPYCQLGLSFEAPRKQLGLIGSAKEAVNDTIWAWDQTLMVLTGLFSGRVNKSLIGGPVAIIQLSARVGKQGLEKLLAFCAFLQVNLALLNMLPIPVLDGGHFVLSLAEGISRRTFSLKVREGIQMAGLAVLLPLFAFVFYNDFERLGWFDWIKGIF